MALFGRGTLAWAVHAYTSLGLVAGFLALNAASEGRPGAMFVYLVLAMVIDASDGTMARAADVHHHAASFDGRKLDDITDYLNYVFIPIYFAHRFDLVGHTLSAVLVMPLLASAYGFCNSSAKTEDGFFTGFPSYWNVFVFYAYLLRTPQELNAALLAILSLLVFVPIRYLYPTRTIPHRKLTLSLSILWCLMVVAIVLDFDSPSRPLVWASLGFPAYYMLLSFWLHYRHADR